MRPQRRVLGDTHAHHVDDLALIGRQALVEEGEVRTFSAGARHVPAFHRVARNTRNRRAGDPWINNWHGHPPVSFTAR